GLGGNAVPLGGLVEGAGVDSAVSITGVSADSRLVEPGFLFVALRGSRDDGTRFVAEAVAAGAAAFVVGSGILPPVASVPVLVSPEPRHTLAIAAARFHPRQPEHLVAVTGTSGKTSV